MKKIHTHIVLCAVAAILAMLTFGACRKAPINGKLDGQWQVMNIEILADGTNRAPALRSYIDINLHVIQLRNTVNNLVAGNLNYDKEASRMAVDFPYHTEGDAFLLLREWGIYENPVTLEIVKIDGSQLILRSPETIITCRRF